MDSDRAHIWIFHGEDARHASGVFTSKARALDWIALHELTGILTKYPVDIGAYDQAVEKGWFRPSSPHHGTPRHVASFSPGRAEHIHVRDGRFDDDE